MYKKTPRARWDLPLVGLIIGIIGPVIGYFAYYLLVISNYYTFDQYLTMSQRPSELSKIISLSLFVNLISFLAFNRVGKLYVARGILIATLLYGGLIVYLKFVV